MTMTRQLTALKLAVFQPDAIPCSFAFTNNGRDVFHSLPFQARALLVCDFAVSKGAPAAVAYLFNRSRIASRARLKARRSP